MSANPTPDIDAVLAEYFDRKALGESVSPAEYLARYPTLAARLTVLRHRL